MPEMTAEERQYWKAVEDIFYQISERYFGMHGRGMILSPKEQEAIKFCAENEVPIRVIKEACERSLSGYKARYGGVVSPGFDYCLPAIRVGWSEYRLSQTGAPIQKARTNGKFDRLPDLIGLLQSKGRSSFYPDAFKSRCRGIAEGIREYQKGLMDGILTAEQLQEYLATESERLRADIRALAHERHVAEGLAKIAKKEYALDIEDYLFEVYSLPTGWL